MLLDAPRIGRLIASLFPAGTGVESLFGRMQHSLFRYTIGQSLASLVMGVSATVGLYVMGVTGIWDAGERYAVLFGLFVALTEFAPSIGPVIGSIPPIIVAMFDGIGPAIAVAVFFLLLHQIEGHIVIPKLMGAAIAVHPLLVIFGILAGAQLLGIGGVLLALPLLAVGRELMQFVRERVRFSSWPTEVSATTLVGTGGIPFHREQVAAPAQSATATSSRTPLATRLGTRFRSALAARKQAPDTQPAEDGPDSKDAP
jgi:predicted PurR-regulated permease PerM